MDLKLPKLGEGSESGTVVSLLVKVGDVVTEGQTLMELENEKAVAPIPASAGGRITSIRVKEGDTVSVGQTFLTVEATAPEPAKSDSQPAPAGAKPAKTSKPAAAAPETRETDEDAPPTRSSLVPAASPSIRRLARDLGIDLARVHGSERGGRIILADLRAYIQKLQETVAQPKSRKATAPGTAPTESIDFSKWGSVTRQPLSALRKTIGRRMAENWNTIPHVTQFDAADITRIDEWRRKYAPVYERETARLTLTSFVLKVVATTLPKHPIFNCSLDEATQELVFKQYYHLGLAVDTEQGLIVPVIRDVDQKNLLQLSREVSELAAKARKRKVTLDELKGGTFSISNQGGIGSGHFTPIINKPEVAILGLGRGARQAMVRDGQIEPRLMLPLTISYDHRVIDGAAAARFAVDLVAGLEQFPEEAVSL